MVKFTELQHLNQTANWDDIIIAYWIPAFAGIANIIDNALGTAVNKIMI